MSALGSETVFVGDVCDGVDDAIGTGVRVAALHDLSLSVGAWVLEESLLVRSDSIRRLVAANEKARFY
jgi:hypothetical protein